MVRRSALAEGGRRPTSAHDTFDMQSEGSDQVPNGKARMSIMIGEETGVNVYCKVVCEPVLNSISILSS
jgi:hypothetical protein